MFVDGYSSERETRNQVDDIISTEWPSVILRPAKPRKGTLSMLCSSLADALAMEALHAAPAPLTLADTDLPALGMTYVADGSIKVELDDDTRDHWWVRVDFQEISP